MLVPIRDKPDVIRLYRSDPGGTVYLRDSAVLHPVEFAELDGIRVAYFVSEMRTGETTTGRCNVVCGMVVDYREGDDVPPVTDELTKERIRRFLESKNGIPYCAFWPERQKDL